MNLLLMLLPLFLELIKWLTSLEKSGKHLTETQKATLREALQAIDEFRTVCGRMGVNE